jgi:hypothetical protein
MCSMMRLASMCFCIAMIMAASGHFITLYLRLDNRIVQNISMAIRD